ncbi:MAG: DCL family protein [Merismopediaceae bacterium]|nr:DCL family protein [Merismopediaceae bacterium]
MAVFKIGDRIFPSKKLAQERIRAILWGYQPETYLDAGDFALVRDLLDLHPSSEIKIGCGVKGIMVRRNMGANCFWLERIDGSLTDFSYIECLKPLSNRQKVLRTLRSLINDQILAFKQDYFRDRETAICEFTGEVLRFNTCHVDHAYPRTFLALVEEWRHGHSLGFEQIAICGSEDGVMGDRLIDPDLESDWQDYHRDNARLRIVSVKANCGILKSLVA